MMKESIQGGGYRRIYQDLSKRLESADIAFEFIAVLVTIFVQELKAYPKRP